MSGGRCPDCGSVISYRFPMHNCEPKLTEEKLKRFIKLRNKSQSNSNLQFDSDAEQCGFSHKDLGKPEKYPLDNIFVGYKWKTPFGILKEENGKMKLEK